MKAMSYVYTIVAYLSLGLITAIVLAGDAPRKATFAERFDAVYDRNH